MIEHLTLIEAVGKINNEIMKQCESEHQSKWYKTFEYRTNGIGNFEIYYGGNCILNNYDDYETVSDFCQFLSKEILSSYPVDKWTKKALKSFKKKST